MEVGSLWDRKSQIPCGRPPRPYRYGGLRAASSPATHTYTRGSYGTPQGKGKPAKPTKLSRSGGFLKKTTGGPPPTTTKRSWGQGQAMMVDITQLVRVSVCGSESRGFNSHYPPIFGLKTSGPFHCGLASSDEAEHRSTNEPGGISSRNSPPLHKRAYSLIGQNLPLIMVMLQVQALLGP